LVSKKARKQQRIFIVLLIASIVFLCADYTASNYYILYKESAFFGIGWSSSIWVLLVPLYYLLSSSFLMGKRVSPVKIFLHTIPFIGSLILNVPFFFLPADVRQEYLLSYSSGQNITLIHIISKLVYHLQLLVYPLLLFFMIRKKNISTSNFIAIINYSLVFVGIGSFLHLFAFNIFGLSISWITSNLIYVLLTLFIHLTAFVLMIRPSWLYVDLKEVVSKYTNSNLANVDKQKIQMDLEDLMNNKKIYTEPDINLNKLADKLSITSHQLSEFLNKENSQSFHEFINFHRINEAMRMLKKAENNLYTIEAIAGEVGYISAATFYRNFKKQTGKSPSRWLESDGLD